MTIHDAWYQAARDAYSVASRNGTSMLVNPTKFIVAGDSACFGDTLQTNSAPQGTWIEPSATQVFP